MSAISSSRSAPASVITTSGTARPDSDVRIARAEPSVCTVASRTASSWVTGFGRMNDALRARASRRSTCGGADEEARLPGASEAAAFELARENQDILVSERAGLEVCAKSALSRYARLGPAVNVNEVGDRVSERRMERRGAGGEGGELEARCCTRGIALIYDYKSKTGGVPGATATLEPTTR